jgi:hypothetical protein
MKIKKLFLPLLASIILGMVSTSCSEEFSPNDEWQETMVVYGILDQDCDTTWIRIQKCFLGNGNSEGFAQIMDSSCYAEDDLEVKIVEWYAKKNNSVLEKTSETGVVFDFNYTVLTNKPQGEFYSNGQPIYYCRTKNKLYTDRVYQLVVRNLKTNKVVTAETSLVGNGISLIKPSTYFQFRDGNVNNRYAILSWTMDEYKMARVFQPVIRFFYLENMETKYVDITASVVRNVTNSSQVQTTVSRTFFGAQLKEKLGVPPEGVERAIVDSVHIFINAGNEALSNYMSISEPPSTIVQERPSFSNIEGGLGIFAARRTKIMEMRPTPGSVTGDYKVFLKSLKIGFE